VSLPKLKIGVSGPNRLKTGGVTNKSKLKRMMSMAEFTFLWLSLLLVDFLLTVAASRCLFVLEHRYNTL